MPSDPPIIELAISLHFEPIFGTTMRDLVGMYEEVFASTYPTFQHAPAAEPLRGVIPTPGEPSFQMISGLDLPRLWFIAADPHDLVQFQHDRIAQNWRRVGAFEASHEYPGYEAVKEKFSRSFQLAWESLKRRGVAGPKLTFAELIYVNAIPMAKDDGSQYRISEVLSFYKAGDKPVPIVNFQAGWAERYPEISGATLVGVQRMNLPDQRPAMGLNLSGRFEVSGLGVAEALDRFDLMHQRIRDIFERVVTPQVSQAAYT